MSVLFSSKIHSQTRLHRSQCTPQCNLYRVLELSDHRVSTTDIKSAYRRLARKYHPDVNSTTQAAERFRAVNHAYKILSNEQLRQAYDAKTFAQEPTPSSSFESHSHQNNHHRQPSTPTRGSDIHLSIELTFEEALLGTERDVDVNALAPCCECQGTRARQGSNPRQCNLCAGQGEIIKTMELEDTWQSKRLVCPACGGRGFHLIEFCRACDGLGLTQQAQHVRVRVPAGVDASTVLKIGSKGNGGEDGGAFGDLWISLEVQPREGIERSGSDLFSDIQIPIWDAMLGSRISVPTIYGNMRTLNIPPGSQHDSVVSLLGEGAVNLQNNTNNSNSNNSSVMSNGRTSRATNDYGINSKGAHHYKVKVRVPSQLTSKEEALLRKLAALQKDNEQKRRY